MKTCGQGHESPKSTDRVNHCERSINTEMQDGFTGKDLGETAIIAILVAFGFDMCDSVRVCVCGQN